ncbi:unnamed protein product, partial [Polarella glacialis]
VVATFLARSDLDLFFHSDDDVLMGASTPLRAVQDYLRDLWGGKWQKPPSTATGGGILALFVNSWLDEQLSKAEPAFGPYAVAPFLGGAAYIADRMTFEATGNPWAKALEADRNVPPHEAHVLWLRQLLPSQGLPIWIRWDKPYECQHLGNVDTLNFGKQPEWEPMWALDHRSKHIVEVAGYSSVELRAALWAGGRALRDFVLAQNAQAVEPLHLPAFVDSTASAEGKGAVRWSPWHYARLHVNYLEIGTSDFDTLLDRHIWRPEVVGFSVEPAKAYFDRLPVHGGQGKTLLNVAVSDHDGYEDLFVVRPELVGAHLGSGSQCRAEGLEQVGLPQCLPGWVRGTSSIKRWPEGVLQLLGEERLKSVLAVTRV